MMKYSLQKNEKMFHFSLRFHIFQNMYSLLNLKSYQDCKNVIIANRVSKTDTDSEWTDTDTIFSNYPGYTDNG